MTALLALADRLSSRFSGVLMVGMVVLMAFVIALAALSELRGYATLWLLPVGVLLAVGVGALFVRSSSFGVLLIVIGATTPLFLGLFLSAAPIRALLVADLPHAHVQGRATPPVVVIVLDELPLATLLDRRGSLDRRRYPHLAQFASGANWYRAATTVHDFTNKALPAIVGGRHVRGTDPPYWYAHPEDNLFRLAGGSGRVVALEDEEDLCPASLCRDEVGSPTAGVGALLAAASRARLRGLTNGRFGIRAHQNQPERFRRFVRAVDQRTSLAYAHVLLPHEPWIYRADGRRNASPTAGVPGLDAADRWRSDATLVARGLARHVNQMRFTDTLLGELLARLRRTRLFDGAMVVVTADHGASFLPGESRRSISRATAGGIAPIPLIVKFPHQHQGHILNVSARSVDVLPTVLDVLGIPLPPKLDGRSLLRPSSVTQPARIYPADPAGPPVEIDPSDLMRLLREELERHFAFEELSRPRSKVP